MLCKEQKTMFGRLLEEARTTPEVLLSEMNRLLPYRTTERELAVAMQPKRVFDKRCASLPKMNRVRADAKMMLQARAAVLEASLERCQPASDAASRQGCTRR